MAGSARGYSVSPPNPVTSQMASSARRKGNEHEKHKVLCHDFSSQITQAAPMWIGHHRHHDATHFNSKDDYKNASPEFDGVCTTGNHEKISFKRILKVTSGVGRCFINLPAVSCH